MQIREATPDDEPAILELLQSSLGWLSGEQDAAGFYRWKHVENPFGPSPAWVAEDGGRLVGVRLFMRWEFRRGHETVRAVRAVDTATHEDFRGKGIFRRLTLRGLEALEREGVAFVFNTPNDQSRPGYLKMGWQVVGRLPAQLRPLAFRSIGRSARARVPASLTSLPCSAGSPAVELLSDQRVAAMIDATSQMRAGTALETRRTPSYLAWRYGYEPLGYRAFAPTGDPAAGIVLFRLRRRGPATEAVVVDVFGEPDAPWRTARALRRAGADHAIALGTTPTLATVPVARLGPVLTTRPLSEAAPPSADGWRLSMGDVELM